MPCRRTRLPLRPARGVSAHAALSILLAALWAGAVGCTADQPARSEDRAPAPAPSAAVSSAPSPQLEEQARAQQRTSRPVLAAQGEVPIDQGDPVAQLRERGSGQVVVVYFPSAGWSYEDAGGRLTGAAVEILRDFFRWVEAREEVELTVTWAADDDWARLYRRVRNGSNGVFGIGNVTITQERRGEVDFSPPYLNNVAVLITHEEVPELPVMEAAPEYFEGFTAYPYRGTLHEERVNRLRELRIPDFRVIPAESNDEILEVISQAPGRLAWIDVYAYWRGVERGLPLRRHPAGDDASETFGVILPRGSDWTPLIEAFFEEREGYRNTPRYRELLEVHLGEGVARLLEEARLAREAAAEQGRRDP